MTLYLNVFEKLLAHISIVLHNNVLISFFFIITLLLEQNEILMYLYLCIYIWICLLKFISNILGQKTE